MTSLGPTLIKGITRHTRFPPVLLGSGYCTEVRGKRPKEFTVYLEEGNMSH